MENKDFLKKQIDNLNDLFDSSKADEKDNNKKMLFDELFELSDDNELADIEAIMFGEQILRAEDNEVSQEELFNLESKILSDEGARNYVDDMSKLCSDLKTLFGKEYPEDPLLV